jgi:lysyl-tRNA synthetase class 2
VTVAVLGVLALAYREFYAKVQRASLPRAIATLATLIVVFAIVGWGLVEAFPGTLPEGLQRLVYSLRQVSGGAFAFEIGREGSPPAG